MTAFKQGIAEITEKYVTKRAGGTDQITKLTFAEGSEIILSLGETKKLTPVFTPENVLNTSLPIHLMMKMWYPSLARGL